MSQVTIRNVDENWVQRAKELAVEQGASMNTVLRNILAENLSDVDPKQKPQTNGLEKFAGTMMFDSPDEEQKWEQFLNEELNQIDTEDWDKTADR